jgi:hypothetical protein
MVKEVSLLLFSVIQRDLELIHRASEFFVHQDALSVRVFLEKALKALEPIYEQAFHDSGGQIYCPDKRRRNALVTVLHVLDKVSKAYSSVRR